MPRLPPVHCSAQHLDRWAVDVVGLGVHAGGSTRAVLFIKRSCPATSRPGLRMGGEQADREFLMGTM